MAIETNRAFITGDTIATMNRHKAEEEMQKADAAFMAVHSTMVDVDSLTIVNAPGKQENIIMGGIEVMPVNREAEQRRETIEKQTTPVLQTSDILLYPNPVMKGQP